MKKRYLLALLPAILVLTSCGIRPVANDKAFLEDTEAHEELFGEVGEAINLNVRKTNAQENNGDVSAQPVAAKSISAPAIGVQYLHANKKYAIRYVAAISDTNVTAVWTRNICQSNGDRRKNGEGDSNQVTVTKAYTALSAAGGVDVPASGQYYVVYTLRNIPESDVNSYLFAYLTLTQGETTVKSLARISRMGEGNTFTINTDSTSGYFIQGTINGVTDIVPINDTPSSDNYAQEAGLNLSANDKFGLFKYQPGNDEHFQCFGYEQYRQCFPYVGKDYQSNYTKILNAGSYNLYLNKSNQVHFIVPDGAKKAVAFYLKPNSDWLSDGARFAMYAFKDPNSTWVDGVEVDDDIFEFSISNWTYEKIIFGRMNPGTSANNFNDGVKWNQTSDLDIDSNCNVYKITGWNNNGSWEF